MIYLDSASTTPIDKVVLEEMQKYMDEDYYNPGSIYNGGTKVAKAVQESREKVARFIGAEPEEIIFTSGGTEANNLVLNSFIRDGARILTSETEHDSILATLEERGDADYVLVSPEPDGTVSATKVMEAIDASHPKLVSIMHTNNETGARNNVEEIGHYCREKEILFHTDCVQAASCECLDVNDICCDFLTISAHKIHGPKGMGALYCRDKSLLKPLIYGGSSQEFGLRGGTENVPAIVGFGVACDEMKEQGYDHQTMMKHILYHCLKVEMKAHNLENIMHINGPAPMKYGKILNVRFDGIDAETLLLMLGSDGIYASAGSACRSHEHKPSRTLLAMGLSPEEAMSSIRFSTSRINESQDMETAANVIANHVATLLNR